VDDALFVGVVQGVADLQRDRQGLRRRHRPGADQRPQVGPRHELHQEVEQPLGLAEVVDGDDAGVAQPGQGARLAHEALGEVRVGFVARRQELQGDGAVQPHLAGLVHLPHAAAAQQRPDLQVREEPGQVGRFRRAGRAVWPRAIGRRAVRRGGVGAPGRQAARTHPTRGAGRQRRATPGTPAQSDFGTLSQGTILFGPHPIHPRPELPPPPDQHRHDRECNHGEIEQFQHGAVSGNASAPRTALGCRRDTPARAADTNGW
jgi:hypothetical protein